ncbi:hypothetical protein H7K13_23590 [Priestia aryabhattai]|uniref:phage minor head protein n=1 Tax=Priestia aryabhattai TaxID=412384 RepID=UPI001C8D5F39|nr:phage minor head protein [Priestia aryabhattai]MBY0077914.1 hypothetical protein [Priestia aryabhattai]
MILADLRSLKSFCRDEQPSPPDNFMYWVRAYITVDSEEDVTSFRDIARDYMMDAANIAGAASLLDLNLDMIFNPRDENMLRWLQERSLREAQLIQGVTDEEVLQVLWDVVYEGDYTIKKAVEGLKDSYAFSDSRAQTIARTEIIGAARSGQFHADRQSGIVIGKKWVSAMQERTRPGHRAASGQVVALDEPFRVANGKGEYESLLFPSDTSLGASASNVISCRCHYQRILEGEDL